MPQQAQEGRLFLSRAQQDEAQSTGTLDRPVKSLLKVDKPLHFGEFTWNDTGIPSGPVWIRIDPRAQLLSVFRDGHEIGTTVIVYGGDNKETPTGTFHILARDKDHRSSLYDAAMPYTLQLTNDGVSIHGSTVRWGAATHDDEPRGLVQAPGEVPQPSRLHARCDRLGCCAGFHRVASLDRAYMYR